MTIRIIMKTMVIDTCKRWAVAYSVWYREDAGNGVQVAICAVYGDEGFAREKGDGPDAPGQLGVRSESRATKRYGELPKKRTDVIIEGVVVATR